MDRGVLAGYRPQGCKESDMTEQRFHFAIATEGLIKWLEVAGRHHCLRISAQCYVAAWIGGELGEE